MACDPQSLTTAAQCFNCIPPSQQWAVLLYLMCQIQQNSGTFVSGQFAFQGSVNSWSATHNLGTTPSFVRGVLVCVADDSMTGYVAGDEVDVLAITQNFSGTTAEFSIGANATQVFASALLPPSQFASSINIIRKGGGTATFTVANFQLKLYATL